MFQTSESCIKLHAVAVLELLLSEQCPLLQVCVCVCVCVSTAPSVCVCVCPLLKVCVLGWVKCREHISLLVILCIIVYVTKKNYYIYYIYFFFQNRYLIMVKCLNIGKNIGKPIYRSISTGNISVLLLSGSASSQIS